MVVQIGAIGTGYLLGFSQLEHGNSRAGPETAIRNDHYKNFRF